MGNQNSNKHTKSKPPLNDEEVKKIKNRLAITKDTLSRQDVFDLWTLEVKDTLLEFYLKYYFPNTSVQTIDVTTLLSLHKCLNGNNIDLKIQLFQSILSNYCDLQSYVKCLLESVLFTYQQNSELKELWSNIKITNEESYLDAYATYLLSDIKHKDDPLEDVLQQWLMNTHEITYLHKYLLNSMFKYKITQPIIPLPTYDPRLNYSILDYAHILFLNLNLMPEFQKEWRLLFNSNFQGESYTKVVSSIINQGPCLVIVKDDCGNIFGAYASTNLSCSPKFFGDGHSFLFKLKPEMSYYTSSGYNENYVYLNVNQQTLPNGLGFGGQFGYWGLFIDAEYGKGECSQSCTTYRDYTMISHNKHFKISHLEVWGVGIPPPSASEKGERSVLDADPTTTAILELAGKKQYSAGIRDLKNDIVEDIESQIVTN